MPMICSYNHRIFAEHASSQACDEMLLFLRRPAPEQQHCQGRIWRSLSPLVRILSPSLRVYNRSRMALLGLVKGLQSTHRLSSIICDVAYANSRAFAAATGQMTAIKALRERTSAPISDVKAALVEAAWDEGVLLASPALCMVGTE